MSRSPQNNRVLQTLRSIFPSTKRDSTGQVYSGRFRIKDTSIGDSSADSQIVKKSKNFIIFLTSSIGYEKDEFNCTSNREVYRA